MQKLDDKVLRACNLVCKISQNYSIKALKMPQENCICIILDVQRRKGSWEAGAEEGRMRKSAKEEGPF